MRSIKPKGINYNTVCTLLTCIIIFIFLFFGSYGLFILTKHNHHITNNNTIHPIRSNILSKQTNRESICDYTGTDVCLLSIYGFFGGLIGCVTIIYIVWERIRLYFSEENGTSYYDLM